MSDLPRNYPLPRTEDDERFKFAVALAVADVLERHGYPKIQSGADLRELQQALFRFLYEPGEWP